MIKDSAKTILCYGDSNTWGNVPRSDDRYPRSVRWPGALQNLLGDGYEVINEGLCGRTFAAVEPGKPHRTGVTHLRAILESADPIDLVIVMIGTNDVKSTFNLSAQEIAAHLDQTLALIQDGPHDLARVPKVLVVCPPAVIRPKASAKSAMGQELDARMVRGLEVSKELPALFRAVAERRGCGFVNAQDHVSSSEIDGYHLDAEAHVRLADALSKKIADSLKKS